MYLLLAVTEALASCQCKASQGAISVASRPIRPMQLPMRQCVWYPWFPFPNPSTVPKTKCPKPLSDLSRMYSVRTGNPSPASQTVPSRGRSWAHAWPVAKQKWPACRILPYRCIFAQGTSASRNFQPNFPVCNNGKPVRIPSSHPESLPTSSIGNFLEPSTEQSITSHSNDLHLHL